MIDSLITSRTRIKLLLKFFLNPSLTAYLRNLESEFGESSNAIRVELNRFEKAKLLKSKMEGNKKIFKANIKHPLYSDINKILLKHTGLDQIIECIAKEAGDLSEVYACGDIAKGINTKTINIIFVGNKIEKNYIDKLVEKAERLISRKIQHIIYNKIDFDDIKITYKSSEILLLWKRL